jgi:hypothetical protein
MNKLSVIPGQETLPIEATTASTPLEPFDPVKYLNANDGLIRLEDLPGFGTDWEREVSLVGLMGEIGLTLAEAPPRSEVADTPLAAYEKDFQNASLKVIRPVLYPSKAAARRLSDALLVQWAEPTYSAPGVLAQDEPVVVTSREFRTFSKNAELIGKHASAHTGSSIDRKNAEAVAKGKEKIDDETAKNQRERAHVHAMEVRMRMLADMDKVFAIEQIGVKAIRELAVYGKDAPKLSLGEMDVYRQIGMFPMLQMVQVAAAQLNYGTNERQGATRALTAAFTRWRRPERRAEALRAYAKVTDEYLDAKRGKVSQAFSDCQIQYYKNKHFLATKNPTAKIT